MQNHRINSDTCMQSESGIDSRKKRLDQQQQLRNIRNWNTLPTHSYTRYIWYECLSVSVCAKCYQRCGGGRWCWWLFLASFHQQKHIEWSIPPAYWHVVNFFLLSQLLTAIVNCAKPVAIRIDRLDKQKRIHRVKKTEKKKEKQQQKKHRKNVMWLERNWMAQNIQRKLCKLLGITHSLTHIVSLYLVCRDFAVCVSLSSWVVAVAFYGQCMCVYFFIFSRWIPFSIW